MHVLIIEDQQQISSFIQKRLQTELHSTFCIDRLDQLDFYLNATDSLNSLDPDIVILDRMMGAKDSIKIIPNLRHKWPNIKILVLSAFGGPKERATTLELGADDYMNKPFDADELVVRLRKLCGRSQLDNITKRETIPDIFVNEQMQDVEVRGKPLKLNRKEYLLARTFIFHPNRVFSRYKLLDLVWDIRAEIESNVVEATISNLRRKFAKAKVNVSIQSRRHIGYWLDTTNSSIAVL